MKYLFGLIALCVLFACDTQKSAVEAGKSQTKKEQKLKEKDLVTRSVESSLSEDITIRGVIRDEDKELIPFVKVTLINESGIVAHATSDVDGFYKMSVPNPGKYTVKISSIGFETKVVELNTNKGEVHTLDITLLFYEDQIKLLKPIIYLYPENTQEILVKVLSEQPLKYTYPAYDNGWTVTAEPNGNLTDGNGKHYYALFWEGSSAMRFNVKDGFVVKGAKTVAFLEEKLAYLGLNEHEINEFIIFWMPFLQDNPYNLIHFSGEEYQEMVPLEISPQPETLIRVMMVYQPLKEFMVFPEQDLRPLYQQRKGFTVVEWGGSQMTSNVQHF